MAANGKHESLQPIHPSMIDRLDPTFIKLYNDNVANTPLKPIDFAQLRKNYSLLYSYGTGPSPEVGRVHDSTINLENGVNLKVRMYEPKSQGPWPVHLDFHGGGWGLGDLETEAHICRHICHKANVCVVDVDYRLVPEHPFPCAIEDCFAVLRYVHKHGRERFGVNVDQITIGGVSAGACISLACAHLARDASIPLKLVVGGTPTIDDIAQYDTAADSPFKSMQENEHAPTLNWARLAYFDKLKWSSLPSDPAARTEAMKRVGWFKNLFDAPNMKNLAPTVLYTAGADPLRDEGERYAQILAENGNEVTMKRFPGVPHPFMHMDKDLWQGRQFIEQVARHIRLASM